MTPASDSVAQSTPKRPVRPSDRPNWPYACMVVECAVLGAACLLTFWLVTHVLARVHSFT